MGAPRPIRVGIGGWDYDPWRGTFYPPGLPKPRQLRFAAERLGAIEINATFYKLQRPELFERWAAQVPEAFRFTVKGSRFCTNRKRLAEAGEPVARFCAQGLTALGDKLGPILWQFADTKRFDADDVRAFFALLPRRQDGIALRHAVEVRHDSFRSPDFVALAQEAGVAICIDDKEGTPLIADATADFAYARLMRTVEDEPEGYGPAALAQWAGRARCWASGADDGLPRLCAVAPSAPREAFVFVIGGAKLRAPAAAAALQARLAA